MNTKYRVNYYFSALITKHLVIKETNARITYHRDPITDAVNEFDKNELIPLTENKLSMYHSWHDTLEDAQEHLILHNKKKIESLLRQIRYLESNIEKVKNIKKF